MGIKKGINQSVAWVTEGFSKIKPWSIARGLILGGLLAGGTMVYFGMTSESTSEAVNSSPQDDSEYRFTDLDVSADGLSVEDLLTYVYPEETGSLSSGNGNADFRFTDLDISADSLSVEDLLTYVYPEETGSLSFGNGHADFRFTDLDVSADSLSVEDLLTFVYPEEGVQAK